MDIATVLNSLSAKVLSLNARDIGGERSTATVTVEVKNIEGLEAIMARLNTISGVTEISRAGD